MISNPTQHAVLTATDIQEKEQKLLAIIQSNAPRKEKMDACREISYIASADAIKPLSDLLYDKELSHMARYALEPIPDPKASQALRMALKDVKGKLLVGVISSLGVRRDIDAVEPIAKHLTDPDDVVAQNAARALGRIGTFAAAQAIMKCMKSVSKSNLLAFCDGAFRCAENMAAQGFKAEALKIYKAIDKKYKQVNKVKTPLQIKTGAELGIDSVKSM
jgi:HEAT repeat protein